MAVTETVKIVFDVDNKAITDTVADLAALGKVSQEDANKFKQLSDASKAASKEVAGLGKSIESVTDAGADVKNLGEGFVPLRTRLKEAKEELQRLSDEFGDFSPQANAARARAGELADEMSDLNRQVNLLNPESKIQAFSTLGQGIVGSFQIATGALQAFGAENEQVQAIAQKLQGALNVVQGLQSVIQLKEAYADVKAVLGFTTVAQQTLTTATAAGTVATNGAAVATRGFAAALTSTGIGAIVVALGALIGAYIAYVNSGEDAVDTNEALKDSNDALKNSTNEVTDSTLRLKVAQGEITSQRAKIIQQRQQESETVKPLIAKNKELAASIVDTQKLLDDLLAAGVKPSDPIVAGLQSEVKKVTDIIQENEESIRNIRKDGKNERKLLEKEEGDESRKTQEENAKKFRDRQKEIEDQKLKDLEDAQKRREEIYANELSLQRQFEQELNSQVGEIDRDLALEKLQNQVQFFGDQNALRKADTQSEISSIDKKLEKLKEFGKEGTDEYKTLTLKRELLVKEGADAEAKAVQDAEKKKQEAAEKTYNQYKELGEKQKKLDEEKRQAQFDTLQFTIEQSQEIADFVGEQGQRETEEKIARLEREREAGLISEEVYQSKLRKIKQKGAEEAKKLQVFQATMNVAQAILSAIATTYPDPTAKIRAVAFASILGAINLAKILATPVPKFKDGTLSVPGQDMGRDSVYAMLRPGEAVIPTETNRMYAPTIEAIYKKRVKASEINAFVLNRMSGKGGIGRDTAITASVDTFALGRVMSKQKTVEVGNANIVGKAIAGEIMKAYNPRRS